LKNKPSIPSLYCSRHKGLHPPSLNVVMDSLIIDSNAITARLVHLTPSPLSFLNSIKLVSRLFLGKAHY